MNKLLIIIFSPLLCYSQQPSIETFFEKYNFNCENYDNELLMEFFEYDTEDDVTPALKAISSFCGFDWSSDHENNNYRSVEDIKEKIYSASDGEVVNIDQGTYYGILQLNNLQNLIIDFSGVELLTKEDVTIFTMKNCSNIKIIGLAIRHERMGCFTNCFDINTCKNISF